MDIRHDSLLPVRYPANRARWALLWSVVLLLGGQLTLSLFIDLCHPSLRDPEFADRLTLLRGRLRQNPGSPLLLLLGSSRTRMGYNPSLFARASAQARNTPLVFNFGLNTTGPVYELFTFKRLLGAGIHPRWLGIEVVPVWLDQGQYHEGKCMPVERVPWNYFALVWRHSAEPWQLALEGIVGRAACAYSCRWTVLAQYLPAWVPAEVLRSQRINNPRVDNSGWQEPCRSIPNETVHQQAWQWARDGNKARLEHFHFTAGPDRALRTILEICRSDGITPFLILMPEDSTFRGWCPLGAIAEIRAYLHCLGQEYGARVVDAWRWLPDDAFIDGHHMMLPGTNRFTRRLNREFLGPLTQGKFALVSKPPSEGSAY